MLLMDLIAENRRRHLVRHESISSIARDLKLCRQTVRSVPSTGRKTLRVYLHQRPEPLDVSLVVAHRQNLSRRVRAFMKWTEETLTPYLE